LLGGLVFKIHLSQSIVGRFDKTKES
jgi:hypothetical protein